MNDSDKQLMQVFLTGLANFSDNEMNEILSRVKVITLKKGEYYFGQGEKVTRLGLVLQGLLKCVRTTRDGKESIIAFPKEGQIVTDFASWLTQEPSSFLIEAIEDCRISTLTYDDYHHFLQTITGWQVLARKNIEIAYLILVKREHTLLNMNAKERHLTFIEENRTIINRLTQKDIASYLGITPVFLSRVSHQK